MTNDKCSDGRITNDGSNGSGGTGAESSTAK